jgi:TonB family protein
MPPVVDSPIIEPTHPPQLDPMDLNLLIPSEPWTRSFTQNLRNLFVNDARNLPPLHLESAPAPFWPDVFVDYKLPWRRFLESGGYHALALIAILAGSRFLALQPHAVVQSPFNHADVIYYTAEEKLPPLDTRRAHTARVRKADPELSPQPVISVPPESDNRTQTIVAAPQVRLKGEVAMPNAVAWSDTPRLPIAPAPLVPASQITRLAPQMQRSVIAPPPDLQAHTKQTVSALEQAVIAPPPSLDDTSHRRVTDIDIAPARVVAPAPQLTLEAQRSLPQRSAGGLRGNAPQVVAPPPSFGASGHTRSGAAVLALSLRPAVGAPPAAASGNRRGTFATGPEGHRGASGEPGSAGSSTSGAGPGKSNDSKLPSGLYVGKSSSGNTVNPNLIANARPPRIERDAQPESGGKITAAEREVFGGRKIYSLSLNMPNLNSAGGSWIIHFTAIKPDAAPDRASQPSADDLSSPVATRKVDPAYPLELMKQNVQGTVILYGVIHADGSVGAVRVLRSVDERLDRFASEALAKWQFQPATKNGTAVDVEATFWIPFRPAKMRSDF